MRYWWHRRAGIRRRRTVALLALFAYMTAIVGVPLPASVNKQHASPFPCQHHSCGCQTAEQCWGECCCYSTSQKLAWAREHHVAPPAHLAAAEADEHETPVDDSRLAATSNACCAKHRAGVDRAGSDQDHATCAHHGACHESGDNGSHVTVTWIMAGGAAAWVCCGV